MKKKKWFCAVCVSYNNEVGSVVKIFPNVPGLVNEVKISLIEEINNRLHESTLLSSLVAAISCARIARRRSPFYPPAAGIQR